MQEAEKLYYKALEAEKINNQINDLLAPKRLTVKSYSEVNIFF